MKKDEFDKVFKKKYFEWGSLKTWKNYNKWEERSATSQFQLPPHYIFRFYSLN